MGILIIPIGTVRPDILHDIADALRGTFKCDVESGRGMPIPHGSYNDKRKQYHSTTIVRELQFLKSGGFDRILGVVDVDLYAPGLNFVFGEADVSSGAAVISLTRLRQEFYGRHQDKGIFHIRAAKEAVHEVGHTYGLSHCPDPRCVMHFSISIRDTDIKGPGFCNRCRFKLGIYLSS